MSIEYSFPVFPNGNLYVQFCESSTVRTIVMLTNEIWLVKAPVLPSTLTLIKHRSILCEIIIYDSVTTFSFFSPDVCVLALYNMIRSLSLTSLLIHYSSALNLNKCPQCAIFHNSCLWLLLLIRIPKEVGTVIHQPASPRPSCPYIHLVQN